MSKERKFKFLKKYGNEKVVTINKDIPLKKEAKINAFIRKECLEVEVEQMKVNGSKMVNAN